MKSQLAKTVAMVICLTFCLSAYAQKKADGKLKGTWHYSLPDAPYQYQKGTIEFKESGGKQAATVKIQEDTISIEEIKKEDGVYKCSLFVDGSDVNVTIKPGAEKMTGTVVADGWEMDLTLTPKK